MPSLTRRSLLATAAVSALSGCSGLSDDGAGAYANGGETAPPTERRTDTGAQSDGADELTVTDVTERLPTAEERLPLPMSPSELRDEARSGGPPKDGIPSIDDPSFLSPDEVDYLDPGDPIFGVARDGVAKAYPQKILVQHEIVNDVLGGEPVSVTYCPLTGTVQGFERGDTTLGVSGRLINNNLVMYDRATEAWWPQILATSIPGPWHEDPATESLREFRLVWTTWEAWRDAHPTTRVLSTDTGYARNYGTDPYGSYNPPDGYYTRESTLFPKLGDDDRYHSKEVVMGARTPDGAAAFLKEAVLEKGLIEGKIGDTPVLAVHDPRFDTVYVYGNPDEKSFGYDDGTVRDEGDSTFAPQSLPLDRIHTFDAMWFAWSGYYPDTNVYE